MAVGVKVVNRPGSLAPADLPAGDRRGAGRHVPPLREELLRQRRPGNRKKTDIATIEYPEEKKAYPERHRGLHRLMLRDDGQVRCVACMMCPTVCPAHCITIVPEEAPDGRIEKRPKIFEIDELRCVVCGLCAEACPCDAIRMDTLDHAKPDLPPRRRHPRQGRADVARHRVDRRPGRRRRASGARRSPGGRRRRRRRRRAGRPAGRPDAAETRPQGYRRRSRASSSSSTSLERELVAR